ncbi:MAG: tetratricopeptide repeat protein [bacterium]
MENRVCIHNLKRGFCPFSPKPERHIFLFFIVLVSSSLIFEFNLFWPDISFAEITSEDSLYTVALGAYNNGFLDLAVDQFQKFLELYPDSKKVPFAWFRIGEACRIQNKNSLAEKAYKKVLDLFPGHKLTHITLFRLSGVMFRQQDFSSAISGYRRLIEEAPSSDFAPEARFWIAESLYHLKRYSEALTAYNTYAGDSNRDKYIPQALYGAGWCLIELGRYDEAVKQFEELLNKNLSEGLISQIHLGLGDALFEQKDYKGALTHYSAYVRDNPEDQDKIVLKKGLALSYLGRDRDAIGIFQAFLNKAPKNDSKIPQVLFQLGQIFFKQKRYKEGVDTFTIIEKRYPDQSLIPEVVLQIGLGYSKMNKTEPAKQYLQKGIKLFSDLEKLSMASFYLGNIYYQEGQLKEAIEFYSKARKTKNSSLAAEASYRLAESLFSSGEHEKALHEYNSLVFSAPDQLLWIQMARFRLGNIYEQKGEEDLALRFYNQVTEMKGGTKDLSQAAQERIMAIRNIKDVRKKGERINEMGRIKDKEKINE